MFAVLSALGLIGVFASVTALRHGRPYLDDNNTISGNWIHGNSTYLIEKLTRDVNTKPLHSHNDYWREHPLYDALRHGAISVEADVWNVNNSRESWSLGVGHDFKYIEGDLAEMYTANLQEMLDQVNSEGEYSHGIFYNEPSVSLFLYIDFKSDDNVLTHSLLHDRYLRSLRESGYLSHRNGTEMVWRPITVVYTGNYPNATTIYKGANDTIYYFLDGHLLNLEKTPVVLTANADFKELLAHCGSNVNSVVRRGYLNDTELNCMELILGNAHNASIYTRIWGAPTWPVKTMERLWLQQWQNLGIDLLNVDDLNLAANVF